MCDPGAMSDPGASQLLRSDAARNRASLVAAAREVFGERGLDAPLDEIARRAGVGNATLYRRFPSRQELIDAVFAERMADYAGAVDAALADPDPWTGFRGYVLHILRLQAVSRGLADLLVTSSADPSSELEQLRTRAYEGVVTLIARAQAAGVLRADFVSQDSWSCFIWGRMPAWSTARPLPRPTRGSGSRLSSSTACTRTPRRPRRRRRPSSRCAPRWQLAGSACLS